MLRSIKRELTLLPSGSNHCPARQSHHFSADIYCGCALLSCRFYRTIASFRATGESVAVIFHQKVSHNKQFRFILYGLKCGAKCPQMLRLK